SLSELALSAEDRALATEAADNAVETLHSLNPQADRPRYVRSLALVIEKLRGKKDAIALLVKGGQWATALPNAPTRRWVLTSFASQLISLEAFTEAQTLLQNDPDPAWRTDT